MTPKQYEKAIAALGLSQVAAGRFLGVTDRTSRNWISGARPVPTAVALLLWLMLAKRISVEQVRSLLKL